MQPSRDTKPKSGECNSGSDVALSKDRVYALLMKHYRLTYSECTNTTSFEQKKMLEALLNVADNSDPSGALHFETEEEYLKWKASRK